MKVIVNGYTGAMGKIVCEKLIDAGHEIIGYVAINAEGGEKQYIHLNEVEEKADVVVDFSHHACTEELTTYCVNQKTPVVICTTGQTDEEKAMIENASKEVPVFFSANMSLGIAVLCDLVQKAVAMFPDADVEVLEVHHNRKIDVPSGTALMLAKSIQKVRPNATLNIGRTGGKRTKEEIGISSLRMGNEVGTHEIYVHTENECITLRHNAYNRAVFADGALKAMEYLVNQNAGLYTMDELIEA